MPQLYFYNYITLQLMPYNTIYAVMWFVQSCAGCFPRLPFNASKKEGCTHAVAGGYQV